MKKSNYCSCYINTYIQQIPPALAQFQKILRKKLKISSTTHFQARAGPRPATGSLVDCKANSRFHTLTFRAPKQ